ncbi:hypothetical protein ACFY0A_34600 [Streptomyces sp. NPDC001698]|uniref:hypothetical protein n=1 Tax=unclassified Streptomyces TaxID=2593676 RepID=UPI0036760BBC
MQAQEVVDRERRVGLREGNEVRGQDGTCLTADELPVDESALGRPDVQQSWDSFFQFAQTHQVT